jgi:hypothetical protein
VQVPHFEDGNFVGPTVLADVKSDMDCYKVFLRICSTIFVAYILLVLIYQRVILIEGLALFIGLGSRYHVQTKTWIALSVYWFQTDIRTFKFCHDITSTLN